MVRPLASKGIMPITGKTVFFDPVLHDTGDEFSLIKYEVDTLPCNTHQQQHDIPYNQSGTTTPYPKKRAKLTHLAPDDKIHRRKVMNRMAAQLARDRKKEKMDEMEHTVNTLQASNNTLRAANEELTRKCTSLTKEVDKLRKMLYAQRSDVTKAGSGDDVSAPTVIASAQSPISLCESAAGCDDFGFLDAGNLAGYDLPRCSTPPPPPNCHFATPPQSLCDLSPSLSPLGASVLEYSNDVSDSQASSETTEDTPRDLTLRTTMVVNACYFPLTDHNYSKCNFTAPLTDLRNEQPIAGVDVTDNFNDIDRLCDLSSDSTFVSVATSDNFSDIADLCEASAATGSVASPPTGDLGDIEKIICDLQQSDPSTTMSFTSLASDSGFSDHDLSIDFLAEQSIFSGSLSDLSFSNSPVEWLSSDNPFQLGVPGFS